MSSIGLYIFPLSESFGHAPHSLPVASSLPSSSAIELESVSNCFWFKNLEVLAFSLFPMKPFMSVSLLLFFLLLSGSQGMYIFKASKEDTLHFTRFKNDGLNSSGTRLLLEEGSLASQHFQVSIFLLQLWFHLVHASQFTEKMIVCWCQVKESSAIQEHGGGARGALHCGPHGGHCSGRVKEIRRSNIRKVKEVHQRMQPGFHEDYFGPRGHKPKHHWNTWCLP